MTDNNVEIKTLNDKKLKAEIEKIHLEIVQIHRDQLRKWVSSVTVVIGVIVSVASVATTLWSVSDQVKAQAEEAKIRSQQLFLTEIIDRIAGTKEQRYHYDGADEKQPTKIVDIRWGSSSQHGAMYAAAHLAQSIAHLCPTVREVFENQASRGEQSRIGRLGIRLLEELENCNTEKS